MSATSTACASRSARAVAALAAAAALAGCAGARVEKTQAGPPKAPPPPPFVAPASANVELVVAEAVAGPEEDVASFTKVFIDGQLVGQTAVGQKSQERRWAGRVPGGNRLFRFEQWYLPHVGDWAALDAQWQPPERFVRVDDAARTTIALKFSEGARRYELNVSRQQLP